MALTETELRAAIEAILFVAAEPTKLDELVELFSDEGQEAVEAQLEVIRRRLEENASGFHLELAAGGYRFATRPEQDSFLRKFFSRQNEGRLSLAALETLAIIAYRQPMTTPEISDIRGVNVSGVLRTLLERRMIRIAGRKNVVGSPFLYRTTREFLTHFGLNSIEDLPRLEEFADILGENLGEDLFAGAASPDEIESDETRAEKMDRGEAIEESPTSATTADDVIPYASGADDLDDLDELDDEPEQVHESVESRGEESSRIDAHDVAKSDSPADSELDASGDSGEPRSDSEKEQVEFVTDNRNR